MRRFIRLLLTLAVVLGVLFVCVGFLLPEQPQTERSIIINASPAQVHNFVGDLERWQQWSPWHEADRELDVVVGPRKSGIGATQSWSSASTNGDLIFTSDSPDEGVTFDMAFHGGAYRAKGTIHYKSDTSDATRVTWTLTGDASSDWSARYRGMFISFMAGRRYARALGRLKAQVEAAVAQ